MKNKILLLSSTFLLLCLLAASALAQAPFRVQGKCPPPNQSTYGSITVGSVGDIRHLPCPSRASIFTGNVDFSSAIVIWPSAISANRFLGGNGTAALPSFSFTSDGDTGFFRTAANTIGISTGGVTRWTVDSFGILAGTGAVANISSAQTLALSAGDDITLSPSLSLIMSGGASTFTLDQATTSTLQTFRFRAGDIGSIGNDTTFILDDVAETITASVNGGTTQWSMDGGSNNTTFSVGNAFNVNAAAYNFDATTTGTFSSTGDMTFREGTTAGMRITAGSGGFVQIGDLTAPNASFLELSTAGATQIYGATGLILGTTVNSLRVNQVGDTLRSTLGTWDTSAAGGAGFGVTNFLLNRTITAAGTTGNVTINLPAGTVNIAAGNAAVTVTNSTVTINSIIMPVARTNDATCMVRNYVPGAGSFVINMTAACTAETSVGFVVTN